MGTPTNASKDQPATPKSTRPGGKIKVTKGPVPLHRETLETGHHQAAHAGFAAGAESQTHAGAHLGTGASQQAPHATGALQPENFGPLPHSYHESSLFLTARDPRWLFAYWDFDWERVPASEMREARRAYFLRVTRDGGAIETQVEIHPGARNWYVPVHRSGTAYTAELGYFDRSSVWRSLIRSQEAHTPFDALAAESHEESFATVPQALTFERLRELVNGHMEEGESLLEAIARITGEGRIQIRRGQKPEWTDEQRRLLAMLLGESLINVIGLGSEEIDRLLRKALQEKLHSEAASGLSGKLAAAFGPGQSSLFSPLGASWSAQPFSVPRERGFFLHLNAEIIFYGGTDPDASVRINGEQIALQPDGSFRYHFTLPDGDFEIPITAVSPDGLEERSGTLSFHRKTRRVGVVGNTAQPEHLEPLIGRRMA